jgi:CRP-like cAMP-binding protein
MDDRPQTAETRDPAHPSSALRLFLEKLLRRSNLSLEAQSAILNLPGDVAQIHRNQDFVIAGTKNTHASLVMAGLTARCGQTRDGQRQITALHIAGDMPDLHSMLLPNVTFWLQALSTATILRVPHAALQQAVGHPEIAQAFWRDGAVDTTIASEWVMNIGRRNAKTRIAHMVCEVAARSGLGSANAFDFSLPITQNQIADATGLSPVHVNRSLQDLKRTGLVFLSGATAHVLDWTGLQSAADFHPAYLHIAKSA